MRAIFDFSKLKGRIVEKYGSQRQFASAVGVSEQTITSKINGRVAISQDDVVTWSELLEIEASDIGAYFFTYRLSNS